MDAVVDRAQGAVLGALVGDSVGSYLEFVKNVKPEALEKALTMPGGGHWGVSPGQITDDGETTLCLLRALNMTKGEYNDNAVATMYLKWAASLPFDMGKATTAALGWAKKLPTTNVAAQVRKRAAVNHRSLANGHMMRCTPLAVLCYQLPIAEVAKIVKADASLTHPAPTILYCSTCYCAAIGMLIRGMDVDDVIAACLEYLEKRKHIEGAAVALQWLTEGLAGQLEPFQPSIGFAKIAFTHGFYHLSKRTPYDLGLKKMLAGGGDTDTNACVVGGLLGAACGLSQLPSDMVMRVATCDTKAKLLRQRPLWLQPTPNIFDGVKLLAMNAMDPSPATTHDQPQETDSTSPNV